MSKIELLGSTPKQNRYIFWHLGLDVKDCNLSLSEAAELIGQMKKEPKFVYDYLTENYGAKVSDATKLQKAINKKEKQVMNNVNVKTKADLCRELHSSDKTLTAKEIAKKVGCDLSVVYRSLDKKSLVKNKPEQPLKYRQVLNHIKKTPMLQSDTALTLENLAESYNHENNTKYNINDFSRCMAMIVKKGYGEKVGRGVYCLEKNNNSEKPIDYKPKEKEINSDKAYEYAVALHKIVGKEEAHKLIDMVSKISNYF